MPTPEERLSALETALIQVNHFTEHIEELKLEQFKGEVTTELKWIKKAVFVGILEAAAILGIGIRFLLTNG